jgi:hypothetical protein
MTHTAESPSRTIRDLGAFEWLFHLVHQRTPAQLAVAGRLNCVVDTDTLAAALDALARRHPILTASIVAAGERAAFEQQGGPIPVREAPFGTHWQDLAEEELATPLPTTGPGALARVVLAQHAAATTIVLTLSHVAADGITSVLVFRDLLRALNGQDLGGPAVGPSLETTAEHAAATLGALPDAPAQEPTDPRMATPGVHRPAHDDHPFVRGTERTADDTAALVHAARANSTTVNGAVLAATATAIAQVKDLDFVRLINLVNVRPVLSAGDATGLLISSATTSADLGQDDDFWAIARGQVEQSLPARTAPFVIAATRGIAAATADLTSPDEAKVIGEHTSRATEGFVSNLGVQDLAVTGDIQAETFWGPIVSTRQLGEVSLGIVTLRGQLRMSVVSDTDPTPILAVITDALRAAAQLP